MKKIIILLSVCLLLLSCKTRIETITKYQKDTVYVNKYSIKTDSIFVLKHDSIIIRKSGDTVFVDRFITNYKDKFVNKTDTLYKYVQNVNNETNIKYVEVNKLTLFQSIQIWFGRILILLLLILIIWFVIKNYKK